MKRTNKKGFTLVELVIVIAIIAILAAVLIPTFAGVVRKANESAALQSARNAYTAIMAETDAKVEDVKGIETNGKKVLNVASKASPTEAETIIDLADYFNGDITVTFENSNTIKVVKGTVTVYITATGASLTNP